MDSLTNLSTWTKSRLPWTSVSNLKEKKKNGREGCLRTGGRWGCDAGSDTIKFDDSTVCISAKKVNSNKLHTKFFFVFSSHSHF